MRKTAKALVLIVISFLATIALGIASAVTASLAFAATALIVPGTGTPNANIVDNYLEQARNRYLTTTACGADGSGCPDANLQGINYPATFFPLVIFNNWCTPTRCNTWDDSVGQGTTNLNAALDAALADPTKPGQQVVVFGYSQGGAVVADSLAGHIASLSDADKARIQVVTIGGIENPDGGLWQRFGPLNYVPFLNISFNPAMPNIPGVNYTSYGFQYDPVVNAPRYFGNPFAIVNALAAFENVHGYYLAPNGNGPTDTLPFGYTDATLAKALDCSQSPANCRYSYDANGNIQNTYVTIPALTLPIADLILSSTPGALTPLVKPFVDLYSPVFRVLADLGYDSSGDPSVPTPLSILPFSPATNPVTVAGNLITATGQGIQAFLGDLGAGAAPLVAPAAVPTDTPALAARSLAVTPPAVAPPAAVDASSPVTSLAAVKKPAPAVADPTPAAASTPAVTTVPAASTSSAVSTATTATDPTPAGTKTVSSTTDPTNTKDVDEKDTTGTDKKATDSSSVAKDAGDVKKADTTSKDDAKKDASGTDTKKDAA